MANKFNFDKVIKNYTLLSRKLPRAAAIVAIKFSDDAFKKQGWTDKALKKWPARKRGQRRNKGRAILVDTGDLRRSIKIKRLSTNRATIGSDLVYAPVHNYGLKSGRGRGFKQKQRQFIGDSKVLEKKITKGIELALGKLFK